MNVRVILMEPQEEGNIGSIARAMANFSCKELYMINPCKIGGIAKAFATHGRDLLQKAVIVDSFDEAVKGCDVIVGTTGKRGCSSSKVRLSLSPEMMAEKASTGGRLGLVFGRERIGLTNEELAKCDFTVRIRTSPKYPVMNLAQSVCLLLYEISKHGQDEKNVVSRAKTERIQMMLHELVQSTDLTQRKKNSMELTIRRILTRSFMREKEASALLSFLNSLHRKL